MTAQTKTEYKTKTVLIWLLRAPLYSVVTIFEAHKKRYSEVINYMHERRMLLLSSGTDSYQTFSHLMFLYPHPLPSFPATHRTETSSMRLKRGQAIRRIGTCCVRAEKSREAVWSFFTVSGLATPMTEFINAVIKEVLVLLFTLRSGSLSAQKQNGFSSCLGFMIRSRGVKLCYKRGTKLKLGATV